MEPQLYDHKRTLQYLFFQTPSTKRPTAKGAVLRLWLKLPAPGLHPPQTPHRDTGNSGARKKCRQTTQHGF